MESDPDLFDVGSVGANSFVKLVTGDAELLAPIGNIGGHLGIDLFGVVRTFGVFFVEGVGFVGFGGIVVLGHWCFLFLDLIRLMKTGVVGMYTGFSSNT